jgi:hypothetical protein
VVMIRDLFDLAAAAVMVGVILTLAHLLGV